VKTYKLGEVCELSKGKTITRATTREGQVPVIGGGLGPTYFHDVDNRKPPVITISASGANAGYVNYWDMPIWASDCTTIVEKPGSPALIGYIYKYLQSRQDFINSELRRGSAQPHVYPSDIANLEIELPSIEKQQKMVEKLDGAFTEIELLEEIHSKRNKELISGLFDNYRDSLLTSACADSPSVDFGKIGNFVRGPFGGSLKKSIFKQSGIAVYEQQHAIYDNFESFRYFIDDNKYQEMKRFEVKANDLIMSCSGTYGKIAIIPEGSPKGIINQALLKITPDKGVRSQFIKHWMQSCLFQVELEKDIGGAALQNVPSVARMKSIKIRLPEEKIQIETIKKLDEFQAEIIQIKAIQEGIKNNYVALRNSLLNSAFTQVEVVA
jgi:type I restriction enzyme S subunit